jgi:hypothetical protein
LEIVLSIAYALFFIVLIRKLPYFRLPGIGKNALTAVFILKIMAGVAMYLVYTYYYTDRGTADIFKYFDDSKVMYNALFTRPLDFFSMLTGFGNDKPHFFAYYDQMHYWFRVYESNIYNDSHTIIRLNALLRIFSFGYYNVHTVFFCFLSLSGLVGIYRFFVHHVTDRGRELFFAVFLLPSVLFWGSGVLKEGILFFGLGILLWHASLLLQGRQKIFSVLCIAASFVLLIYTKFYVIIVMLPLLIAYAWCELTKGRHCILKYSLTLLVFIVAMVNAHYFIPQYDFIGILTQKQNDFLNLAHAVNSGSMISMEPLEPNIWSLLKNMPLALYNGLFRPWIFESTSPFFILAGIENLIIIIIMIMTCVFLNKRVKSMSLLLMCIFFSAGILVLTGLTTPVIGAIVRYKVPAMPFLLVIFIMLIDRDKIVRRFPKFGKFLSA